MTLKQLLKRMDFDPYVKKSGQVHNAKTDAETMDAAREAVKDLIFARDRGLITRQDWQLKQNIELLDVLFDQYLRRGLDA